MCVLYLWSGVGGMRVLHPSEDRHLVEQISQVAWNRRCGSPMNFAPSLQGCSGHRVRRAVGLPTHDRPMGEHVPCGMEQWVELMAPVHRSAWIQPVLGMRAICQENLCGIWSHKQAEVNPQTSLTPGPTKYPDVQRERAVYRLAAIQPKPMPSPSSIDPSV